MIFMINGKILISSLILLLIINYELYFTARQFILYNHVILFSLSQY
jgi:hypothetical protein